MNFVARMMALIASSLCICQAAGQVDSFLASRELVKDLHSSLHELIEVAHVGGNTPAAKRLARIEASIASSFQALPKNSAGRLTPLPVRYLVHNYFAKEHGWQIKGLEPQGMRTNVSEVQEVSILRDRSPFAVERLAEADQADRGLALADIAAMIAMIERLILDEATSLLYSAYFLNGVSASDGVQHGELHEILKSYLLLVEMGMRANLTNIELHQEIKRRVEERGQGWPKIVEFETDAVLSYDYEVRDRTNPFREQEVPFEAASHIVDELAQSYGKWQQAECGRMKDSLMALDTDGSGLIPLSTFYAKSDKMEYQFTESVEYLRQIGAIDDGSKREPRVRIANYVTGPSNCIASSQYYSVCCLNECDGVLNELERSIRAPAASPDRILKLVNKEVASASMVVPRAVNEDLTARLHSIADRNGGEVPLHGRLFAQWLHLAFPHECPYPHMSEDGLELSAHHWLGGKAIATVEQRANHVEQVANTTVIEEEGTVVAATAAHAWSEEDVLPLLEKPRGGLTIASVPVRVVVQVAMCLVVLRMVIGGFSSAANAGSQSSDKKGSKAFSPSVFRTELEV